MGRGFAAASRPQKADHNRHTRGDTMVSSKSWVDIAKEECFFYPHSSLRFGKFDTTLTTKPLCLRSKSYLVFLW